MVWILCFFCPPRPCPCPWSEALSFLCSSARADRGQAWPFPHAGPSAPASPTSGSVSPSGRPEAPEFWPDTDLVRATEHWSLSLHREPSLWGLVTGRSSRPRSLTHCPSAAAAWLCSSANWVSPASPPPPRHRPPFPFPGSCRGCQCAWGGRQGPCQPVLSPRHRQRAVSVLRCPHGAQGALPVPELPAALGRLPGTAGSAVPPQIQVPAAPPLCPPPTRPSSGAHTLSPGLLQLHLRAHPAGAAPGGPQHAHALHHRRQRGLPGRDPGAGERACPPRCSSAC